jgi:hypothetical protein
MKSILRRGLTVIADAKWQYGANLSGEVMEYFDRIRVLFPSVALR